MDDYTAKLQANAQEIEEALDHGDKRAFFAALASGIAIDANHDRAERERHGDRPIVILGPAEDGF